LLLCVYSVLNVQAQNSKLSDYDIKAAYLFNFGRFVEWPSGGESSNGGSFTFCILGHDPFGQNLDHMLVGRTINSKAITVKRIATPQESSGCQILFLDTTEQGKLNKIIEALDDEAVLTVSDIPEFSKHGGMIQFVEKENRVRFEVNLEATQRAGLTLSSDLLKVATAVMRQPR